MKNGISRARALLLTDLTLRRMGLGTGLAIGIALLRLPWRVLGVMLAGDVPYYTRVQAQLSQHFQTTFGLALEG